MDSINKRIALTLILFLIPALASADFFKRSERGRASTFGYTKTVSYHLAEAIETIFPEFQESFDAWPEPPCYLNDGVNNPDYLACNSSYLAPEGDTTDTDVDSFADCRSGKCFRAIYRENEDGHQFVVRKGFWTPDSDSIYLRFYYKQADDHTAGRPAKYKLARILGPSATDLEATLVADPGNVNIEAVTLQGDIGGGQICKANIDFSAFQNQWIKIEAFIKMNSADGVADGECKIWLSENDGTAIASDLRTAVEYKTTASIDRLTWIIGNVSNAIGSCSGWPPCGGDATRTVFIDDVCIDTEESARNSECLIGDIIE